MEDADIIISGAGPVGMLASLLAAGLGMNVIILEQEYLRNPIPRAVGITPPTLEIMEKSGVCKKIINSGVKVVKSKAMHLTGCLGKMDFSGLPGDFPFIMSIPQDITEKILSDEIIKSERIRCLPAHRVTGIKFSENNVTISGERKDGTFFSFKGKFALGCDGGKSAVRQLSGINFKGAPYNDTFIMGDYDDTSGWGNEARLYFTSEGSIESFPLPGNKRRFILRTPYFIKDNSSLYLEEGVKKRSGVDLAGVKKYWESSFGVQKFIAEKFYYKRTFLCGDAAHLMSPIGGQNMNIGFGDAEMAIWSINLILNKKSLPSKIYNLYNQARRMSAISAARRAYFMMRFGTTGGRVWDVIRKHLAFLALHSFITGPLESMFTMFSIPNRNLKHYEKKYLKKLGI